MARMFHSPGILKFQRKQGDRLTLDELQDAGHQLKVDPELIAAFAMTESLGVSFTEFGNPVIRIERGYWRPNEKYMSKAQAKAFLPLKLNPKSQERRWKTFQSMMAIDPDAAIFCTSFGPFQIMGFNHENVGFSDPVAFYNAMKSNERSQINAFVRFVKSSPRLHRALKVADPAPKGKYPLGDISIASEIFNGKKYYVNRYDKKLLKWYEKGRIDVRLQAA